MNVLRLVRSEHLLRTSAGIIVTTVLNLALGYLFWLVAARIAPPGVIGVAAALISAFSTTAILANLGFIGALLQLLPARREPAAWSRTLSAGLVAGGVAGLLGGGIAAAVLGTATDLLARTPLPGLTAVLLAGSTSIWTMCNLLDIAFVAERASGLALARNCLFSVLRAVLLFGLALFGSDSAWLMMTWTLAALVSFVSAYVIGLGRLHRPVRPVLAGVLGELRELRGYLLGQHLITVGAMLPAAVLPTIVEIRAGGASAAYFYTAWMMGGVFFIVAPAVAQVLLSELSHDPLARRATLRRAALAIGALLVPAMVIFATLSRTLLGTFGSRYTAAVPMVLPLIVSAVPDGLTSLQVSVWRADDRRTISAVMTWVTALIAIGGAWLLVRGGGLAAVGWAWCAAQTVGLTIAGADHARLRLRRAGDPRPRRLEVMRAGGDQ